MPVLKMCSMTNGHLAIPKEIREKWLQDPIRSALSYLTEFPTFRYCFEVFAQLLLLNFLMDNDGLCCLLLLIMLFACGGLLFHTKTLIGVSA